MVVLRRKQVVPVPAAVTPSEVAALAARVDELERRIERLVGLLASRGGIDVSDSGGR